MKKYPFKFLDSYNQNDTDIFFGRDDEIKVLYEMIFQTPILLVYGASGTGKTSLIQCGLSGKFKSYEWLPLIVRRGNNINASLEKQLADAGGNDIDDDELTTKDPSKKLTGLSRLIKGIYLNNFKPVYLIFDQFEELYALGTKDEQQIFIESVKEILKVEQPVKIIFSIREEYLGYLYDFETAIPQLLRKKLRVEPMMLEKVKDVLKGINSNKHSNVKIKEAEIDAITQEIFERIRGKKKTLSIELPYLQVFLDKIYLENTHDESRQKDAVITLDLLKGIGDIGDVLRNFLEDQVKSISQKLSTNNIVSSENIWKILSSFCTLEGTKVPISKEVLANKLSHLDASLINAVVDNFVNSRIVKYSENEHLYELAHDSLALHIAEKRSDEEKAVLEVQRLINSQMSVKSEAREFFTERQLLFIEPYLDKLKVSDQEQIWINKSRTRVKKEKNKRLRRISLVMLAAFVISALLFGIMISQTATLKAKKAEGNARIAEEKTTELLELITSGLKGNFVNRNYGEIVERLRIEKTYPLDSLIFARAKTNIPVSGSKKNYNFVLWIDVPVFRKYEIKEVHYGICSSITNQVWISSEASSGFAMGYIGWSACPQVAIDIHLTSGRIIKIDFNMIDYLKNHQ